MTEEIRKKSEAEIIFNAGIVYERLEKILEDEMFQDLSKYSEKWQSEHEKEADTLNDARFYLTHIEETLYEVLDLLKPTE